MELSVTYHAERKGSLTVEKQGLYYVFRAECDMRPAIPLHLYAINGLQSRSLGVLSREGTMTRRLSARASEPLPSAAVLGREEAGFLPWCGMIGEEKISDAWLKREGDRALLALPVTESGEVPLLAYVSQMEHRTVCGTACLCLPLQNGRPVCQPEERNHLCAEEVFEYSSEDEESIAAPQIAEADR